MSLQVTCPKCGASNGWLPSVTTCTACGYHLAAPVLPSPQAKQPEKHRRKLWQILTLWLVWAAVGAVLYAAGARTQTATPKSTPPRPSGPYASATPRVACVYRAHMVDDGGHVIGECEVMLLAKDYVWVQGSEREIENIGDIFQRSSAAFSPWLHQQIIESPEIVVIGTADARGRREREEARAGTRGRNLAQVLSAIKGDGHSMFSVDLGQWIALPVRRIPLDEQRRIIIVRVLSRDTGADFGAGLRNALIKLQNEQPVFRDVLTGYSKSEHLDVR